ncbi:MAG: translesion DNA synthesis-associated protein ImuA [Gammaproteobacteria bacterium]|nr:translesion DNA synthesis-associated protein ImuA [Gammaproteobacteria bacterium]
MKTSPAALETLLRGAQIWRGRDTGRGVGPVGAGSAQARCSTGLQALDAMLPVPGWPESGLVEVLAPAAGLGELSLILPALAAITAADHPVLLVAPPHRPCAQAWQRAGVRLTQLHVLEARAHEACWAMEQALRAGCCGAVLGWPATPDDKTLRRLQVAAEHGRTLGFLFREASQACHASPAPLRLAVETTPAGTLLRVLKCRGRNPPARAIRLRASVLH